MKLKNKLVLSCLALAVCATTMVSTTFAWYTTNTDVSATGAQGHTATTGTDTLLISKDGKAKSWSNSVTFSGLDTELTPVAYGKDGNGKNGETQAKDDENFYNIQADGNLKIDTPATNGVLEFSVYLKNPEANGTPNVYLKSLTIENANSAQLPTKNVLTETGLKGVTSSTYTVDILRTSNVLLYSETIKHGDLGDSQPDDDASLFKSPAKRHLLIQHHLLKVLILLELKQMVLVLTIIIIKLQGKVRHLMDKIL